MTVRKNSSIFILLAGIVLLMVFGTPLFFRKNTFLSSYVANIWRLPNIVEENEALHGEVEELKKSLEKEKGLSQFPDKDDFISARIYSLYPFNTKNRLYLTKGSDDGLEKGRPVVIRGATLIGITESVASNRTEVVTIYDTSFTLPVRIGAHETDALLQGGISPKLTLIDKSKKITSGENIVSGAKDLPYGLEIGKVGNISEDTSGAFFEANVEVSYNLNALREADVLKEWGM